jgi:hypothetical protein
LKDGKDVQFKLIKNIWTFILPDHFIHFRKRLLFIFEIASTASITGHNDGCWLWQPVAGTLPEALLL